MVVADVQRWCPHTRRRDTALDVANCTITILAAAVVGWHRRWLSLSLSLSLSSSLCRRESECLRYGASVVYISGCSEDKTNGILHKYPSSSLLAHTFLSPFLALWFALASSVSLSETSPRKDRHLSPRMFRLGKERERGRGRKEGGRLSSEKQTHL